MKTTTEIYKDDTVSHYTNAKINLTKNITIRLYLAVFFYNQ